MRARTHAHAHARAVGDVSVHVYVQEARQGTPAPTGQQSSVGTAGKESRGSEVQAGGGEDRRPRSARASTVTQRAGPADPVSDDSEDEADVSHLPTCLDVGMSVDELDALTRQARASIDQFNNCTVRACMHVRALAHAQVYAHARMRTRILTEW